MALTNFAYGIEKDWEAVQAAIDIPFSNGLLEGTVNKIKAVKDRCTIGQEANY